MSSKPDQPEGDTRIAFCEVKHGELPPGYAAPEIRRVRDASGRQFIFEVYHELHCLQLTDRADVRCNCNSLMSNLKVVQ